MNSSVAVGKQLLDRPATAESAARKPRPGLENKKRDDALFAELIGPSQERVYRLALRITRNTEDAEDVQQETLLKVHRKLGQFEGRSRLTTWISRIAINEALMCLRKRRSAFYLPLEETIQPAEETADLFVIVGRAVHLQHVAAAGERDHLGSADVLVPELHDLGGVAAVHEGVGDQAIGVSVDDQDRHADLLQVVADEGVVRQAVH